MSHAVLILEHTTEPTAAMERLVEGMSPMTATLVLRAIERMVSAGHGLDETWSEYREAARTVQRLSALRDSPWSAETQAYFDAVAEESRLAARIDGLRRILGGLQ